MIQFFGLHLSIEAATVAVLGRDLSESARVSTRMVNAVRDPETGVHEVPVAEWVRAGSFALQEAYFQLPVASRKAWGLGLAGPDGWILLDIQFEPLSPLRLTGSSSVESDLHRWVEANPRPARKATILLSPKDYFRFVVSGGLAADVASGSRLGLLEPGRSDWSAERATARGIKPQWLPPVFDGHVLTGRLSEDGIRRTSLPGGFWLVAGAHEVEASLVTAGDLRDGRLWRVTQVDGSVLDAMTLPHLNDINAPSGWRAVRSAWQGYQLLERSASAVASDPEAELVSAGFRVNGKAEGKGDPAGGAAVLAAIGSGLIRGWENYYKNRGTGRAS